MPLPENAVAFTIAAGFRSRSVWAIHPAACGCFSVGAKRPKTSNPLARKASNIASIGARSAALT